MTHNGIPVLGAGVVMPNFALTQASASSTEAKTLPGQPYTF
jgi:hypothetical protein